MTLILLFILSCDCSDPCWPLNHHLPPPQRELRRHLQREFKDSSNGSRSASKPFLAPCIEAHSKTTVRSAVYQSTTGDVMEMDIRWVRLAHLATIMIVLGCHLAIALLTRAAPQMMRMPPIPQLHCIKATISQVWIRSCPLPVAAR